MARYFTSNVAVLSRSDICDKVYVYMYMYIYMYMFLNER